MADLKKVIERISGEATPASRLGQACTNALNQWNGLEAFLHDPRLEIDNYAIERHERSVAVGCNNWLFCCNEEGGRRAAVATTLIESCKAAGVEPFADLTNVLERPPRLASRERRGVHPPRLGHPQVGLTRRLPTPSTLTPVPTPRGWCHGTISA